MIRLNLSNRPEWLDLLPGLRIGGSHALAHGIEQQALQLGARLQVLESETDLSYERLLRLYKEVSGKSPSKGQLPFSTDWFMTWQPNIHASLFLNIHEYLNKAAELDEIAGAWKQARAA